MSCYRQSITLISIVIPYYWKGDFSMMLGFKVFYYTAKVLFSSFNNRKRTFYYFNAKTYYKKHAYNLKEYNKTKYWSFEAIQRGCQTKLSWLAFLQLCFISESASLVLFAFFIGTLKLFTL